MNLFNLEHPDTSLVFEPGAWHRVKPKKAIDLPALWRGIARDKNLSKEACLRLEWMLYARDGHTPTQTCKHFGIARSAYYKWRELFEAFGVEALETQSRAPKTTRKRTVTAQEEYRIKALRIAHMHWGKKKLQVLYRREYGERISTWKIECVIRKYALFPRPLDKLKLEVKKKRARVQQRIQDLEPNEAPWNLIHLDTIVIYWGSLKRYILTAEDHYTRVAYARMYSTKSSRSAADFLRRLHVLVDQDLVNIHTDNGSEFELEFNRALTDLGATHWYSRVHTPKDNARLEKFNGTLQYEWLNDGNFNPVLREFNPTLTDFLIEYNFVRPHEALDYLTPFEYLEQTHTKTKVSSMSPASARD